MPDEHGSPGSVAIMALSIRYLLDRLVHPRTRADELSRLRARFSAQPGRWCRDRQLRALGAELRSLRIEMARALVGVRACSRCARGHPPPAGRWPGGHCCGSSTLRIFSPTEVAALKLGGTSVRQLRPARDEHAGCAFRGPQGCSLPACDRPTLCVRYVCLELRQELIDDRRWRPVARLNQRMAACTAEIERRLEARHDEDLGLPPFDEPAPPTPWRA